MNNTHFAECSRSLDNKYDMLKHSHNKVTVKSHDEEHLKLFYSKETGCTHSFGLRACGENKSYYIQYTTHEI